MKYLDIDSTDDDVKTVMQTGYQNFCSKYPTMKECQCYNRSLFDAYKNAKAILSSGSSLPSGNESCWYVPCMYHTNIQVDPTLQQAYGKVQCPNVCQNIVAAVNVKNVSLNNVNLSSDCLASSTNTIKDDISDQMTKKDVEMLLTTKAPPTTAKPQQMSLSDNNPNALFWILVAFGGSLVVILLASLRTRNPKKKTKDMQIQSEDMW